LWLPAALERLAGFTFAVSAAVAVLNMLPLAMLDGGQALQVGTDLHQGFGAA
jgi:membrane-associated protease RseP (regulator of RpoE activity)